MEGDEKVPEASETDNTNIGSEDKIMYSILEGTLKNGIQIDENSKKIDQIITLLSTLVTIKWKDFNTQFEDKLDRHLLKFIKEAKKRLEVDFESLYGNTSNGGRKSRKKRKTKRKRKGRKRKSRRRR